MQMTDYFTQNDLFPTSQSDYRMDHSTTTATVNISDDIFRGLDEKQATVLVLLDLSKAFDSVDHSLLLAKLNYYGFDDLVLSFFHTYLESRYQSVRTNDETSVPQLVASGVPQGSILGPLLFLVYTFDIGTEIRVCSLQSYADDMALFLTFTPADYELSANIINNDLKHIYVYCKNHCLKLNAKKTDMILFCPTTEYEHIQNNMNIVINNETLSFSESVKYLGVIFDKNLRFKEHVKVLLQRVYVRLKLLYANKSILNYKVRKKLCESFVLPIFHYCDILYYFCLDTATKKRIQIAQNTCCRFINNLRKYDHITQHFQQLKWLNMESTARYHLVTFVHRLLLTCTPAYLRNKLIARNQIHNLNIRHYYTLTMPQHSTSLFERSFSYHAIYHYNSVDIQFKTYKMDAFKKIIKSQFLLSQ